LLNIHKLIKDFKKQTKTIALNIQCRNKQTKTLSLHKGK